MTSFLGNGGQIWACGACTKPRGITEDHLIPGARICHRGDGRGSHGEWGLYAGILTHGLRKEEHTGC